MSVGLFIAQTFSSGLLALVGMLLFEPKKIRLIKASTDLEKISDILNQTYLLATIYWSKGGRDAELENKIILARTDTYLLLGQLPQSCKNQLAKDLLKLFFLEITSGDFSRESRAANENVFKNQKKNLHNLKKELLILQPTFNLRTLFFQKI